MDVATVCLYLVVWSGFWDFFEPKKAVSGHKMRIFGRAPPDLAAPPGAPTLSFWLKTWIWQDHHLGFRMARVE